MFFPMVSYILAVFLSRATKCRLYVNACVVWHHWQCERCNA